MTRALSDIGGSNAEARPVGRPIAGGRDWSVNEFLCAAGPGDRPFEERHDGYSIAAVVEGSFTYRADSGVALMHPGALLLGNDGKCFECGHDHSAGDRCISFNFSPELFAEIAAATVGTSRFAFPAPLLPAGKPTIPMLARIAAIGRETAPLYLEELATRLVETVVSALSNPARSPLPPSGRETRRIVDALRHIEAHAAEPVDLAALASLANVSKYHFLRVFRRAIGMTPYQYLLGARLRRAASALARSSDPVSAIAFESGFGDLSTFNGRFRNIFGVSPTRYRAAFAASEIRTARTARRPPPEAGGPPRARRTSDSPE